MPYVTLNDKRLFYTDNDVRNDQPAFILVHGAGGTHIHWPSELRALTDYTVYTVDLPGHGRSDPPGCSTISDYADIVTDFVEALALPRVILVGHSMGGAIAQTIGLQRPTWLTALVLIGTGARMRVTNMILDGLLEDFPKTVSFIMRMCWSGPLVPAVRVALAGREMRLIAPEIVHGDFMACNLFDLRNELGNIQSPTLVVSASDDKMTPLKHNQFLADQIPNAQLAIIKNAGHMMALEYPLQVRDEILKFIKNLQENQP